MTSLKKFNKTVKTALYLRVSKADGTQDISRQLSELRDFCESQNWQIVEEIEEHISGRRINRSGTQKLINLAKSNKIQKVLIHEVSRLGRNACDTYNTVEELAKNKVSVFDFYQRQETLDKHYNKTIYANIILPVLAGLSEQWLQEHTYRIKSGLENARKKGVKIGRPKKDKIKKEDEILRLRKKGYIEYSDGMLKKASYERISKKVGVALRTVEQVCKKYGLNERIDFFSVVDKQNDLKIS
jgi:DNA invertase Pin-like site-specific DNA recombinase